MAKDIADLKAVGQNLMRSNLSITDGIYGILAEVDVRLQIVNLGLEIIDGGGRELSTLISLVKQLEQTLKQQKLGR
jgi:hypothetical protein